MLYVNSFPENRVAMVQSTRNSVFGDLLDFGRRAVARAFEFVRRLVQRIVHFVSDTIELVFRFVRDLFSMVF